MEKQQFTCTVKPIFSNIASFILILDFWCFFLGAERYHIKNALCYSDKLYYILKIGSIIFLILLVMNILQLKYKKIIIDNSNTIKFIDELGKTHYLTPDDIISVFGNEKSFYIYIKFKNDICMSSDFMMINFKELKQFLFLNFINNKP